MMRSQSSDVSISAAIGARLGSAHGLIWGLGLLALVGLIFAPDESMRSVCGGLLILVLGSGVVRFLSSGPEAEKRQGKLATQDGNVSLSGLDLTDPANRDFALAFASLALRKDLPAAEAKVIGPVQDQASIHEMSEVERQTVHLEDQARLNDAVVALMGKVRNAAVLVGASPIGTGALPKPQDPDAPPTQRNTDSSEPA